MLFVTIGSGDAAKDVAIAAATSCELSINATLEELSTKDTGLYDDVEQVGVKWSITSDALMAAKETTSVDATYDDLIDILIAGTAIDVYFGLAGNKADTGRPDTGWTKPTAGRKGSAMTESISLNGAKGSAASMKINLKGRAALTKTA